jgi:alkylation response protein AidB-like acyl-CoA dehydrogenase
VISFELTEEQEIARSMVREFAAQVLRPAARKADTDKQIDRDTLDRLWGLGIAQALIEEVAGDARPQSAISTAIILEELGWADAAFGAAATAPLAFVRAVAEQGTAAQKEELLPLFTGDRYHAAAVALTEPGMLPEALLAGGTWAEPRPDGFVLTGVKTQVPLAEHCSHFLVIARSEGKPDAFIVPRDAPGLTIEQPEGVLGLQSLGLAKIRLDGVQVGSDMRLGGNHGCNVQRIIDSGRVGAAAIMVGICRAVYDHSASYTKERVAHGSALAQKQSVAFRLVDMFIETEAARWMCWRAATYIDKRDDDATRSAVLAHSYTRDQANWITDEGVQLMGGHGFMRVNPVELWYRNAKTLGVLEGIASV